ISMAHERPAWQFVATDLSESALQVAKKNAESSGVAERIEFRAGHLLAPLAGQQFSLLVANLPYIAQNEMQTLSKEVLREPASALLGGATGLELIDALIADLGAYLAPGGWTALEHGLTQGEAVQQLAIAAGFTDVQTRKDL